MSIRFQETKATNTELFRLLHPLLSDWFQQNFKGFTEPQLHAIPNILHRENTLVSAETGTGKTLSAFTAILNELITLADLDKLENKVYCVYISPLRALSNDIHKNLMEPLEAIQQEAEKKGKKIRIPIALRTGDTTAAERQKMLKQAPAILITTPESLAILLNAPKFREKLSAVQWVIIDEIHSLAEGKRGVHLSLSLERLQRLSPNICRIGLSATVAPLEAVAEFLAGEENGKPRNCKIVNVSFLKKMDLKVISPLPDLINVSQKKTQEALYEKLDQLISEHKTTLVFTNTRAATERVVHHLKDKFPQKYMEGNLGAHHSSLSRQHRLDIENRLKQGKLKAVVCLDGDSKILTSDGSWTPIKKLEKTNAQCINEKLKIDHKPIKTKISTVGKKPLLKLTTSLGKEIKCTPNHKFLTINNSNLEWKEAQELKETDFIATVRKTDFQAMSENELQKLCYDHYPNDCFVKMGNSFLEKTKNEMILQFGTLKKFHAEKISSPKIGHFTRSIRGEYLLSIKNLKSIQEEFGINWETIWENIKEVSAAKKTMQKPVLSEEFLRLTGFMAAEGYLSNRAVYWSNRNPALLEYYAGLIKKLRGKEPGRKKSSSGTPILMWDSVFLSKFLKNIGFPTGRKARTIKLPPFFFRLDSEKIFSFLSGYFDGDGFVENKKGERIYSAGFATTSKKMAEDISNLLCREGIMTSIHSKFYDEIQEHAGRKIVKKGWFYEVKTLGGEHLRTFAQKMTPIRENLAKIKEVLDLEGYCHHDTIPNIGSILREERKTKGLSTYRMQITGNPNPIKYEIGNQNPTRQQTQKLIEIYKSKNELLHNLQTSSLFWDTIQCIEKAGFAEVTYNLEVEEHHNYIANGFVTKNCSTSLELGIDIGYIDLVVLLSSPKSVARAIQRMGRSGHRLHEQVKGRLMVLDRDDLVESTILLKSALEKKIDKLQIPQNALDVLAQHIYGIAIAETIHREELFKLIKQSYCYKDLSKNDYLEVLDYLSGKYTSLELRHVYGKIWIDEETGMIGRKGKLARIIYMTNVGTIPDEAHITVKIKEHKIGTIDEGFLERLKKGDVFVLGGETYEFRFAQGMVAQVVTAYQRPPTVPSWFSEMLPLSFDLAMEIQRFRLLMEEHLKAKKTDQQLLSFIETHCHVDETTASAILEYFRQQYRYAEIPTNKKIIVEFFKENDDKRHLIFHSLFGRRTNDALSRAYGFAIGRLIHKDVEIAMNDNGFVISSSSKMPLERALQLVKANELRKLLEMAIERTEILNRRFRHCATRALMILRTYKGRSKSAGRQQVSSRLLLHAVKRIDDNFAILKEARREVLEDLMDIQHAQLIVEGIEKGLIQVKKIEVNSPSPFAFNLYAQGYTDILKMEDRLAFIQRMHQKVLEQIDKKE